MENFLLTVYVLIWPLLAAGVLVVISVAFIRELLSARRNGEDII